MAKMRISPELKKLIEKYRCVKDTEGMSPAKVYKLVGENENLYLKMTDSRYKGTTYDVEREKDMMLWLEGKLPVPKVLHFERHDGWSNLLMSEADGVLCSEEYEDEQSPEKIIELYAECIRLFHSIDISDCPYTNSFVPFPVSWTVKMKKKQKETQDILSYHTQAAGCSDKARAKASGGRQPIEECGRTGL